MKLGLARLARVVAEVVVAAAAAADAMAAAAETVGTAGIAVIMADATKRTCLPQRTPSRIETRRARRSSGLFSFQDFVIDQCLSPMSGVRRVRARQVG